VILNNNHYSNNTKNNKNKRSNNIIIYHNINGNNIINNRIGVTGAKILDSTNVIIAKGNIFQIENHSFFYTEHKKTFTNPFEIG
jgi:hypothetical protein